VPKDVDIPIRPEAFEVSVIGRKPSVDDFDDLHRTLADKETLGRLFSAIASVTDDA
jgi:hypothetical protein